MLTRSRSRATLDRVALDIAKIEYPQLDPEPWIRVLDSLAESVRALAGADSSGPAYIRAANEVLFGKYKLLGNEREYYDVRNSCLNGVLDRRLGIPITLSVIYMEVARRLGRSVYGIALPAHFIVQYDDGVFDTYIDPFYGGETMSREECVRLVKERTGAEPPAASFLPCSPKQIACRMLQNLKSIYVQSGKWDKALSVFALLIAAQASPDEYKQRAVVLMELRRYRAAVNDLAAYLTASPKAEDREDVVKQIAAIQRFVATRN